MQRTVESFWFLNKTCSLNVNMESDIVSINREFIKIQSEAFKCCRGTKLCSECLGEPRRDRFKVDINLEKVDCVAVIKSTCL